jgi:hypothetical protein
MSIKLLNPLLSNDFSRKFPSGETSAHKLAFLKVFDKDFPALLVKELEPLIWPDLFVHQYPCSLMMIELTVVVHHL